ncbi:MAG: hypothetical protein K6A40_04545 [Solobacterium sp.]|nr:hypothetical protein [Solobacterium sp.]
MKKINDPEKLKHLIRINRIDTYFQDADLPFELYVFDRGEFLNNELDPFDYFSFVVSGTIRILNIRDDGSSYQLASGSGFSVLGDLEFGSGTLSPYLVEIVRKTYCVSLPLKKCRQKLENDPVFLRMILQSLSQKLEAVTAAAAVPKNLSERLIHYMQYECEDQTLKAVEKSAARLLCSKRQLLRILKQMCEEGRIKKTGKGTYVLLEKD